MNMNHKRIMFVGDVHGEFEALKFIINEKNKENKIDAVIVCGDYGIWNDFKIDNVPKCYDLNLDIPVYFVDGNHDNHSELDKYEKGKIHNVIGNLFYCSFGSTLTIANYTYLFCGGALSIDKHLRKEGVSWWPTECINEDDMNYLPNCRVDAVVSHTAPFEICRKICENEFWSYNSKKLHNDPSSKFLDKILEQYNPYNWYFGHWHTFFMDYSGHTNYNGFNMVPLISKIDLLNESEESKYELMYKNLLLDKTYDELESSNLLYYGFEEIWYGNN